MDECRKNCKRAVIIEEEKESESSTTSSISKKTKLLGLSEPEETKLPHEVFRGEEERENAATSPAGTTELIWNSCDTGSSRSSSPSRSSSGDSCEDRSFENEDSTCVHNKFRREIYPSSEFSDEEEEEEEMESQPPKREEDKEARREEPPKATRTETMSRKSFDELYEASEREALQKFREKYNFDFANDVPLEGRYEWVRLKQ